MARRDLKVVIPRQADGLITLALAIIEKHVADGANSILNILNMAAMTTLTTQADAKNELGKQLEKDAEEAFEKRNLAIGMEEEQQSITPGTLLFYITSIRDFLLGVFKGKERDLGKWTFVVDDSDHGNVKVAIPYGAPTKLMDLAEGIIDKHLADGAASILNNFDMADMQDKLTTALQEHKRAKKLEYDGEMAIQDRNAALGHSKSQQTITPNTVLFYVASARDVLLGVYRGREKDLGKWGFEVNEGGAGGGTPPTPPPATETIVIATKQNPPAPFSMEFMGTVGEKTTIEWGDGTSDTITMDGSFVSISHTYPVIGNYTISITGAKDAFIEMQALNGQHSSINLPEGINLRGLTLNDNQFGSLFIPATYTDLLALSAANNDIDQQSINLILTTINDFGTSNGVIYLNGGNNQPPSGQGIAAKNALQARGWIVLTN